MCFVLSSTCPTPQLQAISDSVLRLARRASDALAAFAADDADFFGVLILPNARAASLGFSLLPLITTILQHNEKFSNTSVQLIVILNDRL
jgi:hypothetical protein